eukprot:256607_1
MERTTIILWITLECFILSLTMVDAANINKIQYGTADDSTDNVKRSKSITSVKSSTVPLNSLQDTHKFKNSYFPKVNAKDSHDIPKASYDVDSNEPMYETGHLNRTLKAIRDKNKNNRKVKSDGDKYSDRDVLTPLKSFRRVKSYNSVRTSENCRYTQQINEYMEKTGDSCNQEGVIPRWRNRCLTGLPPTERTIIRSKSSRKIKDDEKDGVIPRWRNRCLTGLPPTERTIIRSKSSRKIKDDEKDVYKSLEEFREEYERGIAVYLATTAKPDEIIDPDEKRFNDSSQFDHGYSMFVFRLDSVWADPYGEHLFDNVCRALAIAKHIGIGTTYAAAGATLALIAGKDPKVGALTGSALYYWTRTP